jgi:hypothetical protein
MNDVPVMPDDSDDSDSELNDFAIENSLDDDWTGNDDDDFDSGDVFDDW